MTTIKFADPWGLTQVRALLEHFDLPGKTGLDGVMQEVSCLSRGPKYSIDISKYDRGTTGRLAIERGETDSESPTFAVIFSAKDNRIAASVCFSCCSEVSIGPRVICQLNDGPKRAIFQVAYELESGIYYP